MKFPLILEMLGKGAMPLALQLLQRNQQQPLGYLPSPGLRNIIRKRDWPINKMQEELGNGWEYSYDPIRRPPVDLGFYRGNNEFYGPPSFRNQRGMY